MRRTVFVPRVYSERQPEFRLTAFNRRALITREPSIMSDATGLRLHSDGTVSVSTLHENEAVSVEIALLPAEMRDFAAQLQKLASEIESNPASLAKLMVLRSDTLGTA